MKLKSRTTFPPNGFCLLLPEVGMAKNLSGSFREMVEAFAAIVRKNPALAQKLGWPTERIGQENFVEQRECQRLIAQGWVTFVDMSGPLPPGETMPVPVKKNVLGRVVDVGRASKSGIGVWLELFGSDGLPVDKALAEKRATICAACPHNDVERRLEDYFILAMVNSLKFAYEMCRDLKLETTHDPKLGICRTCLCPLKVKVHVKLQHILNTMAEPTRQSLPAHCWIVRNDQ